MRKEAIEPLTELKTDVVMVFWNTIYQQEVQGMITKDDVGFQFTFNQLTGDMESGVNTDEAKQYLLSTEERLDEEDILNVNEIMFGNNLSFIEYKED